MADLVATTLYSHEGAQNTPLAPATTAAQVRLADAAGKDSTAEAEIITLRKKVNEVLEGGVSFKGALTANSGLPTVGYKAGWQYAVKDPGTYAGQVCEAGDLVICVKDYASGSASNSDWSVVQANIVGAVTGPESSVAQHVAVFDGTSGKILKDSGFTIGKSVPADAQFTDTTYKPATDEADGLMSAGEHTKLAGIEAGADKTDTENVKAAGAFMKSTDTLDGVTDGTTYKKLTAAEKSKLAGIASGAEVNQNAFGVVQVGANAFNATGKTDKLTLIGGTGIDLAAVQTASFGTTVTIKETYIDSCVVSDLDSVPANLRNGGLVILKS